ncbi:MAG: hypothetical protein IKL83_04715, partial [Muribaculaceae bacterium]|nr:hypothetical protein [Muribaculaceae bacterium]
KRCRIFGISFFVIPAHQPSPTPTTIGPPMHTTPAYAPPRVSPMERRPTGLRLLPEAPYALPPALIAKL